MLPCSGGSLGGLNLISLFDTIAEKCRTGEILRGQVKSQEIGPHLLFLSINKKSVDVPWHAHHPPQARPQDI